jgi:predicted RNase H-like nuclease
MQSPDVNFGISRALAIFCQIISQFLYYNMDLSSSSRTISIAQSVHNSRKTDRSIAFATLASKSQSAEAQSDHVICEYLAAYFWLLA